MTNIKLPTISIGKFDKIWLSALYEKIKKGEKTSYKALRLELINELPENFRPSDIDQLLINYDGDRISYLGIHNIAPDNTIIYDADKIILYIKELILKDPNRGIALTSAEISAHMNLPEHYVQFLLEIIWKYCGLFQSGTPCRDNHGYSQVETSTSHDSFNKLLYFQSLSILIEKYYQYEIERREAEKRKSLGKTEAKIQKEDTDLSRVDINPIFRSRITETDKKLCFVLMPFKMQWSDDVYKNIKDSAEGVGLQCLRADNLRGAIIIEDIWIKINQAGLIIADVTKKNPNVMYELGIAHTMGKPTILITQNIKEVPFDFAHLRHYLYTNSISGSEFFKNTLGNIIREVYSASYPDVILPS